MKTLAALSALLMIVLLGATFDRLMPAEAQEQQTICTQHAGEDLDGLVVVTVYNQKGDMPETYDVDYALNVYLTRSDGSRFSVLPRGYYNRATWGQYFAYHIKCGVNGAVVQDTMVTLVNAERTGHTTFYSECFAPQGAPPPSYGVYTQAATLPEGVGTNQAFSVAKCLMKQLGY